MRHRDRPTRAALDRLLDRLGPEIDRLLTGQGLSQAEGDARLSELVHELAARWDRVGDRERWLLEAVNRTPPRLSIPSKEPEHE